jgi:hypothetical protein
MTIPRIIASTESKKENIKKRVPMMRGRYGKNGALNGLSNSFLLYRKRTAAKLMNAMEKKYIKIIISSVKPVEGIIMMKRRAIIIFTKTVITENWFF